MPQQQTALLRQFVALCKSNPNILHSPDFAFYKEYLESLGATIPPPTAEGCPHGEHSHPHGEHSHPHEAHGHEKASDNKPTEPAHEPEPEPEEPEEPLELDQTGVIERESDDPLPMGDPSHEATEEQLEQSNEKRSAAMAAFSDGNMEEAVKLFTEAIELNPGSALLHAKRANALLKMNKPVNAIRDCDKAISINPDSAQAYKFRGRAHRLLGEWLEAHKDLAMACKLDYDDVANEWLKEVEPNAKKILEHQRNKERIAEEKLLREKKARIQRAQEERRKAQEEQDKRDKEEGGRMPGGMGGMPGGMGGMPGGMGGIPPELAGIFSDPELMALFQDPEVMQAYMEIMQNPGSIAKYMTNPKVMKLVQLIQSKASAAGGMGDDEGPTPPSGGGSAPQPPPTMAPEPDID